MGKAIDKVAKRLRELTRELSHPERIKVSPEIWTKLLAEVDKDSLPYMDLSTVARGGHPPLFGLPVEVSREVADDPGFEIVCRP